ncbi:MAG: HNH/ENDO VII family nuclease [Lachnospiraceae bacterium]|nr:HNH/ENDO VII family nuclease [Lachnospiraceae bacterium]
MSKRNIKRIISVFLIFIIAFIGCKPQNISSSTEMIPVSVDNQGVEEEEFPEVLLDADGNVLYSSMSDEDLLEYIENDLYYKIVRELDNDEYFVESISAKYISQEYLDEIEYNSKPNIYFGYTLAELDEEFQGTRYVFTLGENGETVVKEFQEYDDTYDQIVRNVAIGTGVILVCVVVSIVTHGAGAVAVSTMFAVAAKTGTVVALSDGALSAVVCGAIEGIETGDVEKALKTGALEGSKSFKWGAIVGCVTGGATKFYDLYKGTQTGLSLSEVATIQKESKLPTDIIKQFHSMEEYKVFAEANLEPKVINGKSVLFNNNIDWHDTLDELGRNNLERVKKGLAPIDATGQKYELHHIGQNADGTLAILTQAEHDKPGLHGFKLVSEIDRNEFNQFRTKFWKTIGKMIEEGTL